MRMALDVAKAGRVPLSRVMPEFRFISIFIISYRDRTRELDELVNHGQLAMRQMGADVIRRRSVGFSQTRSV